VELPPPAVSDRLSGAAPLGRRLAPKLTRPRPRSVGDVPAEPPPTAELQSLDEESGSPCVPMISKLALEVILDELACAMQQCRQLYLSCVLRQGGSPGDVSRHAALALDRLHRCLLIKICAAIAEADGRWTYEEQRCAAARAAARGDSLFSGTARADSGLPLPAPRRSSMAAPVAAFSGFPELRDQQAELVTTVTRVAN